MDYTTQSCGDSPKKALSESLSKKQDSMESSFLSWLKSASRLLRPQEISQEEKTQEGQSGERNVSKELFSAANYPPKV